MKRPIFWRMKDAFFGAGFITYIPKNFLIFPVLVGIPTYTISAFQSGVVFYDEFDSDVKENEKE